MRLHPASLPCACRPALQRTLALGGKAATEAAAAAVAASAQAAVAKRAVSRRLKSIRSRRQLAGDVDGSSGGDGGLLPTRSPRSLHGLRPAGAGSALEPGTPCAAAHDDVAPISPTGPFEEIQPAEGSQHQHQDGGSHQHSDTQAEAGMMPGSPSGTATATTSAVAAQPSNLAQRPSSSATPVDSRNPWRP